MSHTGKLPFVPLTEIVVEPNSDPQTDFIMSDEYEVLYGGAAGGGKSLALVLDPLRYINEPEFTGIIFRRTYPELEGSILPHTQKLYPHAGGKFNIQSKIWTFPSGATIRLGFMQHRDDWQNYQGHEYAYQGFDELTTFHKIQFDMLRAWNRSKCRVNPYRRATSNPGGVGHAWVKQEFVDQCRPVADGPQVWSELAKMYWQPMKGGPGFAYRIPDMDAQLSRRFIPARVFDNEDMLRNNPLYLHALMSLPPYRRKAFLEGDWDVFEGQFFSMWRPDLHVVPMLTKKIPSSYKIVGGLDYGQRTVLEVAFQTHDGMTVNFLEVYTVEEDPQSRANKIADALIEYGLNRILIVYDTTMSVTMENYMASKKSPLAIFQQVFKERMGENRPRMSPVSKKPVDRTNYRVVANEVVKSMLSWKADTEGRIVKRPQLFITENCSHLIKTLPELVHDPDSFRGLDFDQDEGEDDPFDALKYMSMRISPPKKEKPAESKEWWEYSVEENSQGPSVYSWRDPHRV